MNPETPFKKSIIGSLRHPPEELKEMDIITDESDFPPPLPPLPDKENPIKKSAKAVDAKEKNSLT